VSFETGVAFSSNAGNLKLELADFTESVRRETAPADKVEMEIER
jgi:hypothetical protein